MLRTYLATLVAAAMLATSPAIAQQQGGNMNDDRPIYGRQMMTEQEMNAYRERLRNAESAEERAQIRTEHQAEMRARAKERGLEMPRQGRDGMRGQRGNGRGAGGGMGGGGTGAGRGN